MRTETMTKLTHDQLMPLEQYHRARNDFRAKVMAHKKNRRVQIGPYAVLYFEDRLTMQYQIQEMLRIERIFEAKGIEEELGAYNPLIPDGANWKATFMLEYPDIEERRAALARLKGPACAGPRDARQDFQVSLAHSVRAGAMIPGLAPLARASAALRSSRVRFRRTRNARPQWLYGAMSLLLRPSRRAYLVLRAIASLSMARSGSRTGHGYKWRASERSFLSPTKTSNARTRPRPRPCTFCASSSRPRWCVE
jgi:hypothetical protein